MSLRAPFSVVQYMHSGMGFWRYHVRRDAVQTTLCGLPGKRTAEIVESVNSRLGEIVHELPQ